MLITRRGGVGIGHSEPSNRLDLWFQRTTSNYKY